MIQTEVKLHEELDTIVTFAHILKDLIKDEVTLIISNTETFVTLENHRAKCF